MDKYRILYFSFLLISFILSVCCKKSEKGLGIFPYLLGFSIIAEIIVVILAYLKINYFFVYHLYVPVEYYLWTRYFYLISEKNNTRKIINISIPVFIAASLFLSFSVVKFKDFPNLQLNIQGFLLVVWATIAIFTIEIKDGRSIFSRPVFWICVAVLVYYSVIFSFMGVYNFISNSGRELLVMLQFYLLTIPNYILYTCLSVAFICSQKIKR